MKPLIGVTSVRTAVPESPFDLPSAGVHREYTDAIFAAGGLPVILPRSADAAALREMAERLDGLLLTGGGNVSPELYGQQPHPKANRPDSERDFYEIELYRSAVRAGKPVLGICRGMQLINVAEGGTLHQHIADDVPGASDHSASTNAGNPAYIAHLLKIETGSQLAAALGVAEIKANSRHFQAVREVGRGLVVTARAEDGVVEAIEYRAGVAAGSAAGAVGGRFVVGVQCHPESLYADAEAQWTGLFKAFVAAATEGTAATS